VPSENREDHYGRDCIDIATRQLIDHSIATEEEIKSWHQQFADEVQRAVAQAQQEAVPDPYHEDWSALSSRISAAHQHPNPTAQPS
jgi:TPP-dependent pyruvate/acetoin dehydrogenase alpha subunit